MQTFHGPSRKIQTISKRGKLDAHIVTIRRMLHDNYSPNQIAQAFDVHGTTVRKFMRRYRLSRPYARNCEVCREPAGI